MLSDRCLSVTFVYCGQTVGWIRMPLGMEVGLGPGHVVLDGDPAPPISGPCLLWPNGWMDQDATLPLGTEVGLGRGHIVSDGDRAAPHGKGTAPTFRPTAVTWSPVSATAELWFSDAKGLDEIPVGSPPMGAPNTHGV